MKTRRAGGRVGRVWTAAILCSNGAAAFFAGGLAHSRWASDAHHSRSLEMDSSRLPDASFAAWLDSNGIKDRRVSVGAADAAQGGGRGLRATTDLSAGTTVASVPFDLCLTAESASKSPVGNLLQEFDGWSGAAGLIAVQLLFEKSQGAKSQWAPWIATLPTAGEAGALDLPMFWPQEELALLKGCSTRPIQDLATELDEDFEWLSEHVFEVKPELFAFDDLQTEWRWAMGVVLSRTFFLDGATRLVPFVDFVNHDPTCGQEVSVGAAGMIGLAGKAVKIVTDRAYKAGEEVMVTYGARSGAEYLEEYGFVPADVGESMRGSICELVFQVDETVEFADDKELILEEQGLDATAAFELNPNEGGEPDPEMMQFLRLLCLGDTDAFLLEPVFLNDVWGFMGLPVSESNENKILETLVGRCQQALADFEASPSLLADPSTPRAKAVAAVRRGEFAAVTATLKWCEREQQLLNLKEYYQERRLRELSLDKDLEADEVVDPSKVAGAGKIDW